MARAIWTGTISFGLVSIPVGLFSATEDHTIHFHQFQRDTSDRIRNRRVNERTGKEVEFSDIVKGADVGDDGYVIVEPDELDSIAPGRSRSLEISDFVDLDEIDPIYFNKTYWLAPTSEDHAHPYGVLLDAMTKTNRAAIGSFVMRGKEYLAAIRPSGVVLALQTLYFADEVRDPGEQLDTLPGKGSTKPKELTMATQLIEAMAGPWNPEGYHDTYRDRVAKLIEDKHEGREVVTESAAPEPTAMSDLLAALERSVQAKSGGGSAKKQTSKGSSKRSSKASSTGSAKGSTNGSSKRAAGAEQPTKSELAEQARELDIPGRSRMNRDELAEAIEAARGATSKKAS
jgi:DNA end-binding protein Ku